MKPLEFKISVSVESYDEKTAENLQTLLHCRKTLSLQTIIDADPKF